MNISVFFLIFLGVSLNALAQLCLKAGTNKLGVLLVGNLFESAVRVLFQPYIFAGLFCYVLSVSIWIVALSKAPVSIAYPMLSMGYIIVLLLGWWWLNEPLSVNKTIGIGVIIFGIYLVSKG